MTDLKFHFILILLTCAAASAAQVRIESFDYADDRAAAAAWKPGLESPPAGVMPARTGKGRALRLPCDFSRLEDRGLWDHDVKLDLSALSRFSFWVYVDNPAAVARGTLYFRGVTGWYGGWFAIEKKGWQQVILRKSDFKTEDAPAGWRRIEGIRVSFWKQAPVDTVVGLQDLEGETAEIVVVRGNLTIRKKSAGSRSAEQFASAMAQMLQDMGVEFGVLEDTDVEAGGLSHARIALFPYNPDMSPRELQAVERFVERGGRIVLFYELPGPMAKLLGIEKVKWMRAEYPGQFERLRFDPHALPALPEAIFQGSWNVNVPRTVDPQAKVIGWWVDAGGKATGIPAMTRNPAGVYMAHVLMPGDAAGKSQMLLALLGGLVPDLRPALSYAMLKGIGRVGALDGFEPVSAAVTARAARLPDARREEALKQLALARSVCRQAIDASRADRFADTLRLCRESRRLMLDAWFLSLPARKGEFRAVWCHAAAGVPGWTWEQAVAHLAASGFTAVIPNMLWGGVAYYPSKVLPVAEGVSATDDPLRQCLDACRRHGVQIHVWKVCWNLSHAPASFVARMRREGRLQHDRAGKEILWLCPSDDRNFQLERDALVEVVRLYPVDGIHFDYIRYPHAGACYCAGCRARFEKSRGAAVAHWPADVVSGELAGAYRTWRCAQITRLVRSVSEDTRKIRPGVRISAAVFSSYPQCRDSVGQDWVAWVRAGYLDFVCPMDYSESDAQFRNLASAQKALVAGRVPVYPGIGVTASSSSLRPEQAAEQIRIVRALGLPGFVLFNYGRPLAADCLPALRKGITAP